MKSYSPRQETPIGVRLQRLRESREIDRKDLAKLSGVTYQSIYFIETGMRPPGLSVIVRLVDALKLNLSQTLNLLGITEPSDYASNREERGFASLFNILNRLCDCEEDLENIKIIDKQLNDKARKRSST